VEAPSNRKPISVALLRHLPHGRSHSMDRFARSLSEALGATAGVDPFSLPERPRPLGGGLRDGHARLIAYPRAVATAEAEAFHILDQGYAHAARSLPRGRTIVTCHDLLPVAASTRELQFRFPRLTTLRYRLLVPQLARVAHVACDSEAARRDAIELAGLDPSRCTVIRPGIDPAFGPLSPRAARAARASLGSRRGPLLLHVSSGRTFKNVAGTIRVLGALRRGGIEARLVRAGQPMTRADRQLASRLGVGEEVLEQGVVSERRLVELYNAVDVLLFPSFAEGFGWPPLEAMACGTPAVVSDCPALLETTQGAALSAPADDHVALAVAVARVLLSPETASHLRARGARRASEFKWASTARDYARLYGAVLASS
jgi:glycosyltransferase involved in cell wall biosynthesis